MQIVKVIEKPEWPKYFVNLENGARIRVFSKSDVPRKGYVAEADYEKAREKAARAAAKA